LLLALPLAAVYLWLGQMPLSLTRAACMLLFTTVMVFFKRPKSLLDGVLAAVAFLLAFDPFFLFDLSLQLSILSVAIIALCLPGLSRLAQGLFPEQALQGFLLSDQVFFVSGRICGPLSGRLSDQLKLLRMFLFQRLPRAVVLLLGISFCIQTALLPLTAQAFNSAGLCFPLNLLWLPALGVFVMPMAFVGLVLAGMGLDLPASAALYLASLPCEALMTLLHRLDAAGLLLAPLMPRLHWVSSAGFWLLCLLLPGLFRRHADGVHRRHTLLFCVGGLAMLLLPPALALYADQQAGVRLRLLDVGQGQSVLLEWSGLPSVDAKDGLRSSGRVLVDGGGVAGDSFDVGKSIVAPVLLDNALPRLDMVINTHPDADHLAGLMYILENFSVRRYWSNGDRAAPALEKREQAALRRSGLTRMTLQAGSRLELAPELYLETLWPDAAQPPGSPGEKKGNDASLIVRLVWRKKSLALLCGDAESSTLRTLLAKIHAQSDNVSPTGLCNVREGEHNPNALLAAQVLLLPHHGSAGSMVPGFYEAVRPTIALASCGYDNQWGFPAAAIQKALQRLNIPFYDTARYGQIQISWRDPDRAPELVLAREAEK
jgi:competence protein ComEC